MCLGLLNVTTVRGIAFKVAPHLAHERFSTVFYPARKRTCTVQAEDQFWQNTFSRRVHLSRLY